ncbi:MAG: M20/M25/M40 family metallo-hydrolase, partial [Oscillospiraceae bacterium]|nr:M20/M25/M40 family metallo-hydrolase [Oscillospiraceae bacterium]
MNEEIRCSIDKFAEENYESIFRDIGRLIAVDSVRTEEKPGMPFGEGCHNAKVLAMEIIRELGLEAKDCEGMLCYASVGGDSDKYLATITHLDVVPVGEGWTSDPFGMVDKDGYIIGRGVLDDKGPSVVCLYALKYLKDNGIELKYPVRALLGLAEET